VAVQLGGNAEKLFAGQLNVTVLAIPEATKEVLVVAAGEVMGVPAELILNAVH
jgi:hypothetical protein